MDASNFFAWLAIVSFVAAILCAVGGMIYAGKNFQLADKLMCGALMLMIIMFCAGMIACITQTYEYDHGSFEIESLNDQFGANGEFVFGCGNVGSSIYYVVMTNSTDGLQQVVISSDYVDVYLKPDCDIPDKGIIEYWVRDDYTHDTEKQIMRKAAKIIIHVPPDAIKKDMSVDGT